MRLLFVDRDNQTARKLHSEFLDYRGVNWSLTHCTDRQVAMRHLEQDNFQCVLLHAHQGLEEAFVDLHDLIQTANCPPVVTLAEQLSVADQLRMVQAGCDDCFSHTEVNGLAIMRLLRMADTRNAVWKRQLTEIADSPWLAESILPSSDSLVLSQSRETIVAVPNAIRVAHVAYGTPLVDSRWFANPESTLQRYQSLEALNEQFDENPQVCDAVLVEQSVFEEASPPALARFRQFLAVIPGLVVTLEKSDFASLSHLERGFSDCLNIDRTTGPSLLMAIQKSIVRRRRGLLASITRPQVGPGVSDRRASVRSAQNRRRHVRFFAERPILAIPVLSNGAPDLQGRCDATTVDVSLGGVGVKIPERDQLPSRNWILGVLQGGKMAWVNAYLRRVAYGNRELQAGLIFQNDDDDLLHRRNLWPLIHPESKRFETAIPASALNQWVELGVLERQLVRRSRVCPECEAICSVGTGCSQCGGYDLTFHDLIHHFACAHVNHAEAFERNRSLQCPKCLQDHLVCGADFELIRSQYTCSHCDYQGDETAEVGCCLNCQLRFPISMGKEVEIYGYHVERLDVLALVDGAR